MATGAFEISAGDGNAQSGFAQWQGATSDFCPRHHGFLR
jgi:hypothetical protein